MTLGSDDLPPKEAVSITESVQVAGQRLRHARTVAKISLMIILHLERMDKSIFFYLLQLYYFLLSAQELFFRVE